MSVHFNLKKFLTYKENEFYLKLCKLDGEIGLPTGYIGEDEPPAIEGYKLSIGSGFIRLKLYCI